MCVGRVLHVLLAGFVVKNSCHVAATVGCQVLRTRVEDMGVEVCAFSRVLLLHVPSPATCSGGWESTGSSSSCFVRLCVRCMIAWCASGAFEGACQHVECPGLWMGPAFTAPVQSDLDHQINPGGVTDCGKCCECC